MKEGGRKKRRGNEEVRERGSRRKSEGGREWEKGRGRMEGGRKGRGREKRRGSERGREDRESEGRRDRGSGRVGEREREGGRKGGREGERDKERGREDRGITLSGFCRQTLAWNKIDQSQIFSLFCLLLLMCSSVHQPGKVPAEVGAEPQQALWQVRHWPGQFEWTHPLLIQGSVESIDF